MGYSNLDVRATEEQRWRIRDLDEPKALEPGRMGRGTTRQISTADIPGLTGMLPLAIQRVDFQIDLASRSRERSMTRTRQPIWFSSQRSREEGLRGAPERYCIPVGHEQQGRCPGRGL